MTSEARIARIFTVPELGEDQPLDEDSLAEAWFAAHDTDQIDAVNADDAYESEPVRPRRVLGWQHAAFLAFACGIPMLAELFGPWGPPLPQHVQQIAARLAPAPRTRSIPAPAPRVLETATVTPEAAATAQDDAPPAELAVAEPAEAADPVEETPRPAPKPVARPARVRSPEEIERAALKTQYQRVGRTLVAAQRRLGAVAVADVASRYQWIRLDAALATPTSRHLASSTLKQLQARLDALPARRASHTVVLR